MSLQPRARRSPRRAAALLVTVAAIALVGAGCVTDLVPPATPAATATPTPSPTATPTSTPTPTPTPPEVVDGPYLAGVGVEHCPGKTVNGAKGTLASEISTNWSGYAITTAKTVTTCVEAEWVQPVVKCRGPTRTSVSIWVGLGGFSQARLEQIGTAIDCVAGSPFDYSWHESLPQERNEIDAPVPVQPGDRVWAQVRFIGGSTYQLSLANLTHPDGFTVNDTNKGLRRVEAEWVAEAPSSCGSTCRVLSMPNWGGIRFEHIAVTVAGVRATLKADASTRFRIRLLSKSGVIRATVTTTSGDGSSFVVTWKHA